MRHGKKNNHLSRTVSHRKAMLSNMAASLILHKRINTTLAKAKALRKYVEPLLTKSKSDSTHSRRLVFRSLQNKYAVSELFREVAGKIAERPGGYTRIIRTGTRQGDAAEMCMMELVDFNTLYVKEKASAKKAKTTRRGRTRKVNPASGQPEEKDDATQATVAESGQEEKTPAAKKAEAESPADKEEKGKKDSK